MLKNSPDWLVSGFTIVPAVAVICLVLFTVTLGGINPLFWLVLPAILFETLVEARFPVLADSYAANLAFALLFWFAIGAATGLLNSFARRWRA